MASDTEVALPSGGGAAGPPWPDEKDAVPGRLGNPFRPASAVFLGGAASHLFGLALAARSRVDVNLASAGAEGNAPASCYPLLAVKSCPAVPDRAVPPLRALRVDVVQGGQRVRQHLSTLPQWRLWTAMTFH